MNLSIITAFDKHQLIGCQNHLPWNIPEDLAYFKKTTLQHSIIMGRKTFESIGKPLPRRSNIVISSTLSHPDVIILDKPHKIFQLNLESAFIIGGATLYEYFLPYCQKLYITHIDETFQGDTYFPKIDWSQWQLASEVPFISQNINCRFSVYHRKQDLQSNIDTL